jgi:8-oxo-dGTP diphosphatase
MTSPDKKPFIDVAAGLILRSDGALLLGQRPADKPWPGWWELPGGKLEPGETALQALARELKEELDIDVTHATPWVTYVHEYPKNIVRLAFCKVTGWAGEPRCMENQQLAWVNPNEAPQVGPLLPATEPPMRWLRVPQTCLLTSIGSPENLAAFLEHLNQALQNGLRLVQFREPGWPDGPAAANLHTALTHVLAACHAHGARCLVNSVHPQSWWNLADGVHLRAADALAFSQGMPGPASQTGQAHHTAHNKTLESHYAKPEPHPLLGLRSGQWLSASAHNPQELAAARWLNAGFVVIGHVLPTPSHPDKPALGWDAFANLAGQAGLPVLAIGGQSEATREQAGRHGAHGIAGIRLA